MKRTRIGTISICARLLAALLIISTAITHAAPNASEIRAEVETFQQFFQTRFPSVPLPDYRNGVAALPQFSQKQLNRSLLVVFPPWEHAMQRARDTWVKPLPSGATLENCFAGRPPAGAYPYLRENVLRTVVGDINSCFGENGAAELDPLSGLMAELEAVYTERWSGQPIDVDFRSDAIRTWYEKGRQFFWARRGQMNLSCASCHVDNAGNRLRGTVLSAALGHGAGFPAWRLGGLVEGGSMTTLHGRYAACNEMAGAAPFDAQGAEYLALEVYQAIMNSGVPVSVPSVRQ